MSERRYGKPAPKGGKPAPRRPMENPRLTALNILQDITRGDAYASLALGKRLRESRLDQRDKDLVTELVYGTLERQITLDFFLDRLMERPEIDSVVRDIMRLGAYQILFLDRVPDSAAVDESVKLSRLLTRDMFAGLINGVLRNLSRQKDALPWPDQAAEPAKYVSIRHGLPQWIAERLIAAYGLEEAEAIAAYQPSERYITVRRTPERTTPAAFEAMMAERGWQWKPGRIEGTYTVRGIGDIGIDKAFLQGLYSVQGEGSMLAAMAVAPKRAATVLDACAAPGGKSALLSEQMGGMGRVHAWDIHEHRVELIRGMVSRLKLDNIRPAVRDATVVREDLTGTMDAVLLDAPCTGFGVMLQKPDVKLRQTPEDVEQLVEVQRKLLDACCQYVRPGGTLVYSTCTILPEENIQQVQAFLARHPEFSLDERGLKAAMPAFIRDQIHDGTLQLQAHRDGMEGFFIARMVRGK